MGIRLLRARGGSPLVLLVFSVVLFGLVALDVELGGLLARADPHVARWCAEHVTGDTHRVVAWLTRLGDAWFLTGVVLLALPMPIARRRYHDAALLALAGAVVGLVTTGLKDVFRRARPPFIDADQLPHSFSFPSGHASGATAVYILVAVICTTGAPREVRLAALAAAVSLALVIAVTRVLLPVHYVTDVIGGGCVGLAVVAATLLARSAFRRDG